jgi:hypothetical protein
MVERKHNEKLWNMSIIDKVAMNLLRMFNINIYKTIDTFMKIRPLFQPPHSKDFMNLTNDVCSPAFQDFVFLIVGGEGTPMCEVDLDLKPMYIMFNVDGNMKSNPTTLTTDLNKHVTLTIPINNFPTPTMLINEKSSAH